MKSNPDRTASAGASSPRNQFCGRTRREFLWEAGAGFTGVAMAAMLEQDGFFKKYANAESAPADDLNLLAPKSPHFVPKAKRCIFLFMYGGPSQMDLFDHKPYLQKNDGKTVDIEIRRRSIQKQKLLGSRREFKRRGESGLWCSDALPRIAGHMDKLAVVKSLYMDSFAHGSALLQIN